MQRLSRPEAAASEGRPSTRALRFAWRVWRVFATALSFALAGLLSLLIAAIVPGARMLSGTRERAELRTQTVIHWATRFYWVCVGGIGAIRLRAGDREKLGRPGILVVANHPTLLDAWALFSLMPQADCIVKQAYYENLFLGGPARGAGFIPNRDGPGVVDRCVERLRGGRSVIIFPEGTRSPKDALGPFARGAAHIALRAQCDPIPVTIRCDPATLYRGRAWWDVPERVPLLTLTVGDPVSIEDVVAAGLSRGRAARALTTHFREYFERQLNYG